jgi:hypothetical protein
VPPNMLSAIHYRLISWFIAALISGMAKGFSLWSLKYGPEGLNVNSQVWIDDIVLAFTGVMKFVNKTSTTIKLTIIANLLRDIVPPNTTRFKYCRYHWLIKLPPNAYI